MGWRVDGYLASFPSWLSSGTQMYVCHKLSLSVLITQAAKVDCLALKRTLKI